MRKRVACLFILFILATVAEAQVTFRRFIHGTTNNLPRSSCAVPGGGYLVCSSGNSFIRLDSAGNILWAKTVQSPVYIENVTASSDSGFLFSGYTYNFGPPVYSEIAAGKLDANGNLLWLSVIDSTNKSIKTMPVPTSDGGVIIGTTENPSFNSGMFVIGLARFSPLGQLLWHKIVFASGNQNFLFDLRPSGNEFIASARQDTIAWMFRFDDQGNVTMSRNNTSVQSFTQSPYELAKTAGGYVGVTRTDFLFFYDTSGTAISRRKYTVANGTLVLENLLATNDGGLLVGGRVVNGDSTMLLMKTDASGNVSWATTYDTTVRFIRDMHEAPGGYFILREMQLTNDLFILKTDLQGHANCGEGNLSVTMQNLGGLFSYSQNYYASTSWAQSWYPITAVAQAKTYTEFWNCQPAGVNEIGNPDFSVSPNPSSGIFRLNGISADAQIEVYNMQGEIVLAEKDENLIDLSSQPAGIYLLRVKTGEQIFSEKLLLQH